MDILQLTTSDAVRAVLGVSEEELSDDVFYHSEINEELLLFTNDWLGNLTSPTDISTIKTNGEDPGATALEQDLLTILKLYAKYQAAVIVSPHMRMGVAKETSDGQNIFNRWDKAAQETMSLVLDKASAYKRMLMTKLGETVTDLSLMGTSSPSYDPVDGETEA